jgi:large subunit ribosomal protein L18Ae
MYIRLCLITLSCLVQIIRTATVPAAMCKRANTLQFHDSKIKFPLTRKVRGRTVTT